MIKRGSSSSSSSSGFFGLGGLIVLFYNFGDNTFDLYDLICDALVKYIGG